MGKNQPKKDRAFTLVETIVAIFILVLAVTGPMSAAQNSLKASFLARDQVVAFYLAQDIIEYIKNQRDENAVNGISLIDTNIMGKVVNGNSNQTYKLYYFDSLGTSDSCGVVNNGHSFEEVSNSCLNNLKIIEDGFYGINGSIESKYKRLVSVQQRTDNPDEYEIVVQVSWKANYFLTERKIVVQENIFDWIPN